MHRVLRWLGWSGAAIAGLQLLIVALAILTLNTQPGRRLFERLLPRLTAGEVAIVGLSGRFPDAQRASRVELKDGFGVWLVIHDVELLWSPSRLLRGEIRIDRLAAEHVSVDRLPAYPPDTDEADWNLPLPTSVVVLRVEQLDLSPEIIGASATLNLSGSGCFTSLQQAALQLALSRHDQAGHYQTTVRLEPTQLHIDLSLDEPPQGLLAAWSGLSELGGLSLTGGLDGPPSSAEVRLQLAAGALKAQLQGRVNLEKEALDLQLAAVAPEMRLRPDVYWQAAKLDAAIKGPYTQPKASGILRIDQMQAAESSIRQIAAEITGDATGELQFRATLGQIRVPGPQPDLFASAPMILEASARLEQSARPLSFTLRHPLLRAQGKLNAAADPRGDILVNFPDITPFLTVGEIDARGSMELRLQAAQIGEAIRLESTGELNLTGGKHAVVGLLGDTTRIDASFMFKGPEIALSQLNVLGKFLRLSADGQYTPSRADLNWKASITDLSSLRPEISGRMAAEGRLTGPTKDLSLTATVSGEMSSKRVPGGPFKGEFQLRGLTGSPRGTLAARATLAGSAVDTVLNVALQPTREMRITIEKADWKSARMQGVLMLPKGSPWPTGTLEWRIDRLEDIAPLLGKPLTGAALATLTMSQRGPESLATLRIDASHVGTTAVKVNAIRSFATFTEIGKNSKLEGNLSLVDYAIGTLGGSAQLDFSGPFDGLKIALSATSGPANATPVELSSTAVLNTQEALLDVSTLRATWRSETLRLLTPARFNLAEGASVDSLRLGLRQAELHVAGRLSPALDLEGKMRNVPVDLAALAIPDLLADGSLNVETRLTGPYDQPRGTISLQLGGVRLREGPGRGLPPAELNLSANLDGRAAQVDARLHAGPYTMLSLKGRAPIATDGILDLRCEGRLDMKMLDPLLTPQGQRVRGVLTASTRIGGTLLEPHLDGDLQLTKGEIQDYALGARMADIVATAQFDRETIRLTRLDGKMGPGRVAAVGSLGLRGQGLPIDVKITARNAQALSGERLNVTLNSDLDIRGAAQGRLNVGGHIHIRKAEIRIPERMPARIAVLHVRKPNAAPPPPPTPGRDFGLGLTIDAPGEIFVRGRGLDAELGGKVLLQGTASNPEPTGSFAMRQGEFQLAGRTLTFSRGEVGFDGGTLMDPALDFIATTASPNVTATLAVGGTAGKPKISLSSIPDLPQDEVLAQLLFGRNTASLGPLEMAQIASALASLTGVTGNIGNPLETVRRGLGLDRLSMSSSKAGPTLEAGRYIAPGVYLGARQGFTGTTPQAAVQVEVTEGLKVEGTVGTGSPTSSQSGTSSVGVIYQFEY